MESLGIEGSIEGSPWSSLYTWPWGSFWGPESGPPCSGGPLSSRAISTLSAESSKAHSILQGFLHLGRPWGCEGEEGRGKSRLVEASSGASRSGNHLPFPHWLGPRSPLTPSWDHQLPGHYPPSGITLSPSLHPPGPLLSSRVLASLWGPFLPPGWALHHLWFHSILWMPRSTLQTQLSTLWGVVLNPLGSPLPSGPSPHWGLYPPGPLFVLQGALPGHSLPV